MSESSRLWPVRSDSKQGRDDNSDQKRKAETLAYSEFDSDDTIEEDNSTTPRAPVTKPATPHATPRSFFPQTYAPQHIPGSTFQTPINLTTSPSKKPLYGTFFSPPNAHRTRQEFEEKMGPVSQVGPTPVGRMVGPTTPSVSHRLPLISPFGQLSGGQRPNSTLSHQGTPNIAGLFTPLHSSSPAHHLYSSSPAQHHVSSPATQLHLSSPATHEYAGPATQQGLKYTSLPIQQYATQAIQQHVPGPVSPNQTNLLASWKKELNTVEETAKALHHEMRKYAAPETPEYERMLHTQQWNRIRERHDCIQRGLKLLSDPLNEQSKLEFGRLQEWLMRRLPNGDQILAVKRQQQQEAAKAIQSSLQQALHQQAGLQQAHSQHTLSQQASIQQPPAHPALPNQDATQQDTSQEAPAQSSFPQQKTSQQVSYKRRLPQQDHSQQDTSQQDTSQQGLSKRHRSQQFPPERYRPQQDASQQRHSKQHYYQPVPPKQSRMQQAQARYVRLSDTHGPRIDSTEIRSNSQYWKTLEASVVPVSEQQGSKDIYNFRMMREKMLLDADLNFKRHFDDALEEARQAAESNAEQKAKRNAETLKKLKIVKESMLAALTPTKLKEYEARQATQKSAPPQRPQRARRDHPRTPFNQLSQYHMQYAGKTPDAEYIRLVETDKAAGHTQVASTTAQPRHYFTSQYDNISNDGRYPPLSYHMEYIGDQPAYVMGNIIFYPEPSTACASVVNEKNQKPNEQEINWMEIAAANYPIDIVDGYVPATDEPVIQAESLILMDHADTTMGRASTEEVASNEGAYNIWRRETLEKVRMRNRS